MNLMHIVKTIAELSLILGFFAIAILSLPGNPARENRNHTNRTTRKEK